MEALIGCQVFLSCHEETGDIVLVGEGVIEEADSKNLLVCITATKEGIATAQLWCDGDTLSDLGFAVRLDRYFLA